MLFLNKLGANVRNHMSIIEDSFVEQARQTFPAAQKQPRIPQVKTVSPNNANLGLNLNLNSTLGSSPAPPKLIVDIPRVLPKKGETPGKPMETEPLVEKIPAPAPSVELAPDSSIKMEIPPRISPVMDHPGPVAAKASKLTGLKPSINNQPAAQGKTPHGETVKKEAPVVERPNSILGQAGVKSVSNQQAGLAKPLPSPSRPSQAQKRNNSQEHNAALERNATKERNAGQVKSEQQPPVQGHKKPHSEHGRNQSHSASKADSRSQSGSSRQGAGNRQSAKSGKLEEQIERKIETRLQSKFQPPAARRAPVKPIKPVGPVTNVKSIQLPAFMSVKDFSQLIEVAAGDVIKKLIGLGVMATINQEIDRDTMMLLADEYGIVASAALTEEQKLQVEEIEDDPESLISRPPVVTIMGHVDHGKTSLLDAIRETNVIAQEAGGITQHIGAYQVELKDRKITFLDTPGHAAFTAMRARGAQVTDIAVLVVAADDGVMPQTVEAINHAKDANVSIIVAINKIDKPGANPERIKQDLTEYGLVAEEWGGDTIFVQVSAKKRIGIEHLLEMILLVADIKDYRANPNRPAKGTIIEAQLDKGRGPVATVLVQNGTLQVGDSIIAGAAAGRVRVLNNDKGKRVKKAGPSTPVEVIGFNDVPEAGDIMYVISEDRLARELADKRLQYKRENELKKNQKITLDDLFAKIKEGAIKELKVIIKADVQGSVEAIRHSLERLSNQEVRVKVIHGGVGGIGEGDVMLASASNAIIIGFNVRPDPNSKRLAEKENVDIRLYRIIYNIIEDVQKAMEGMLAPEYQEVINGRAEIRAIYRIPKVGNIAGCYVIEGKISRNSEIRLIRDNIVIHEGKIESLKRFKDDAREVSEGFECGVGIEKFNDIKEGDIIEAYSMEEVKRASSVATQ